MADRQWAAADSRATEMVGSLPLSHSNRSTASPRGGTPRAGTGAAAHASSIATTPNTTAAGRGLFSQRARAAAASAQEASATALHSSSADAAPPQRKPRVPLLSARHMPTRSISRERSFTPNTNGSVYADGWGSVKGGAAPPKGETSLLLYAADVSRRPASAAFVAAASKVVGPHGSFSRMLHKD